LTNDKTVEECGIKNDDFLVLMVKKPAGKSVASSIPTANISNPPPSTALPPSTDTSKNDKPQQTDSNISADEKNASESLVTGAELEASIANIVGMGFPREQVVEAMKVAFNNPPRAVELLTSGLPLPTTTAPPPSQPPQQTTVPHPSGATTGNTAQQQQQQPQPQQPSGGQRGAGSVFDGLKQHPQFPMLCMLAQQGGQDALRQILEYFSQVSKPLLNLIIQNQEEFIRLLSTPITATDLSTATASPPPGPTTPGVVRLTVTPEDERAIHNIVSMGFDRNRVLEAYFLFEKDEQQTINFLLNNPDSDN